MSNEEVADDWYGTFFCQKCHQPISVSARDLVRQAAAWALVCPKCQKQMALSERDIPVYVRLTIPQSGIT